MSATLLALVVFAQVAVGWPVPWAEAAYLTDHPIRPDRAGLATAHGWFAVEATGGRCDLFPIYSDVVVTPTTDGQVVLVNAAGDRCEVRLRLMAWQGCQINADGQCSSPGPP